MRHIVQEEPPAILDATTGTAVLQLVPCKVHPGRLCGICQEEDDTMTESTREKWTRNRWRDKLTQLLDEASRAHKYWQVSGPEWAALVRQADRDAINLQDVLREIGVQVLDRAVSGALHIG